jgi:tetratricopeptide (TPR) repeat protein
MDSEEYEKAVEAWSKAIELNPKYNSAYGNRGIAKARLGDHIGAIKDFDKAIELKNEIEAEVAEEMLEGFLYWKVETHYNRGLSKKEFGQLDQAVLDFQESMKLRHDPEACAKRISECRELMKK